MANVFSGSEIVSFGIQIEKNGRDFYNTLALRTKSEEAKKVFEFLSGEEEKHIAVFQKIAQSLQEHALSETYPGEYFAYIKMLANDYVFTQVDKGKEVARNTLNDKDAIDVGIKFEEKSIIFYDKMKKTVPENEARVVGKMAEQENNHLFKLLKLKNNI